MKDDERAPGYGWGRGGPGQVKRRRFLGGLTAGTAGLVVAGEGPARATPAAHATRTTGAGRPLRSNPFTLGVASGDPLPDAVVLWTRLAPEPLASSGGMPDHPIPVHWQVATDEAMTKTVRSGRAIAWPEYAHSVHVDVSGLRPARPYYYRFKVGSWLSPTARTKTAPPERGKLNAVTYAFASCQSYDNGYYNAQRHLAEEDLDFVVFLGDYIYENESPHPRLLDRIHEPHHELHTLDDYRIRYAQYKTDPHLQACHAAFPWIVTADDHDVDNDYAGEYSNYFPYIGVEEFLIRRANAYRAFWEHMPLRAGPPEQTGLPLYRRFRFGDLISMSVLDTRQYSDDQHPVCSDSERAPSGYCPPALDPSRTMLGRDQMRWLLDGIRGSDRRWNVLANPEFFTQRDHDPDTGHREFNPNTWDGYVADRQRILDLVVQRKITNLVINTGDSHQNWVQDTPPNFRDWDAKPVATEFLGTSLTSGGDRAYVERYDFDPANNPQLRFQNNSHGYVRCHVTRNEWHTDYLVVPTVEETGAPLRTLCTWAVERGAPGAQLLSKG